MSSNGSRYWNIVLGIWLFISAFAWPHSQAQLTNTWIMGVIVVVASAISLRAPAARYVNTVVGAWLIISSFALPRVSTGTTWNNFLVGLLVLLLSLAPSSEALMHRRQVTT
jgi:hypothetical protein